MSVSVEYSAVIAASRWVDTINPQTGTVQTLNGENDTPLFTVVPDTVFEGIILKTDSADARTLGSIARRNRAGVTEHPIPITDVHATSLFLLAGDKEAQEAARERIALVFYDTPRGVRRHTISVVPTVALSAPGWAGYISHLKQGLGEQFGPDDFAPDPEVGADSFLLQLAKSAQIENLVPLGKTRGVAVGCRLVDRAETEAVPTYGSLQLVFSNPWLTQNAVLPTAGRHEQAALRAVFEGARTILTAQS